MIRNDLELLSLVNNNKTKHNMSTLVTTVKAVTPELAAEILSKLEKSQTEGTFRQRNARDRAIHRYAQDMKAGKWILTHQGIAFDDKERLIDGQNRLWAVVRSKVTVLMTVTTGVPHNGKLTAMDVIDIGSPRTVAQAFQVSHGYGSEAGEVANLARQIVRMVMSTRDSLGTEKKVTGQTVQVSVAEALFVIEELNYINSFERLCAIITQRSLRRAPLVAPWCWYHMIKPKKAEQFATAYATLEGLEIGSPALALFRYFTNPTQQRRVRTSETEKQSITASALRCHDSGTKLLKTLPSVKEALRWLVKENEAHADKILKRVLL